MSPGPLDPYQWLGWSLLTGRVCIDSEYSNFLNGCQYLTVTLLTAKRFMHTTRPTMWWNRNFTMKKNPIMFCLKCKWKSCIAWHDGDERKMTKSYFCFEKSFKQVLLRLNFPKSFEENVTLYLNLLYFIIHGPIIKFYE